MPSTTSIFSSSAKATTTKRTLLLVLLLFLVGGTTTDARTGGGGDPHFSTWSGEKFTFHGECDLVLLSNPSYLDGLGMHVHVRTKAHDDTWSDIERVAIRIGSDVFEARGAYEYWINGKPGGAAASLLLPALIGGYQVSVQQLNANRDRLVYVVNLGGDKEIRIRAFGEMMWVDIKGAEESPRFGGSEGLLGDHESGLKTARDGTTVINNSNDFGQEWQVRPDVDPVLFRTAEGPQYPRQKCNVPVRTTNNNSKQLRNTNKGNNKALPMEEQAIRLATAAKKACARLAAIGERDDCVYDVLATKDLEVAQAYAY